MSFIVGSTGTTMPYAIVEFLKDNGTAVIPTKWMNSEEDICYYPKKGNANKKIVNLCDPAPTWPTYDIRVLGKAVSLDRAREKLQDSVEKSDLNTDTEEIGQKRKRKYGKQVSHIVFHVSYFQCTLYLSVCLHCIRVIAAAVQFK